MATHRVGASRAPDFHKEEEWNITMPMPLK
jgi:hypothetical protein